MNSFRAINEPPHDKMTSASSEGSDQHGQRPVWWESSLAPWRNIGTLATHWVHSEDSVQTGRMRRLIWVFAGHIWHFVCFVMMRFKYKFLKRLTWNFRAFEYTTPVCFVLAIYHMQQYAKTQGDICPVWSESSLGEWTPPPLKKKNNKTLGP